MEFTTENVETAVLEFYSNPGKVNKECHEWLKSCQSSREAWHIVWPLLEPVKMLQVQFVAANMLHYKVSRCLIEIPELEYAGLKDKLVETVARYISGPSVVLTRLCLTLGAFVTNTIGLVWISPLDDLASMFSPQNFTGVPEVTVLRLLVQVFGYIPEQAQSQWQSSVRKGQAYRELQDKGQTMYSWLFNVVKTQKDVELVVESLKAMNSWMKMICIFEWPELFEFEDLLVSYCVTSIETDEGQLNDLTLEILSGIIGDPMAHQYPTMILKTLDKIIPLQSSLDLILQRQDMVRMAYKELASSFYGMYVALADCHSKLVVDVCDPDSLHSKADPRNRENSLSLIKLLLQCTDYPGVYPVDEIISNITISVWYSLVEDIQAHQSDRLKYFRVMQVFEEVYQTLAKILVKKARYPVNTSDWNSEELEQFRVYRQDVCDCFTYCFELRGWTMLNELVDWTETHLVAMDSNPDEINTRWPELESLLMGIRAVAENISDETDPVVIAPMNRVFSVIYRILKFNRDGKVPKLFQGAIECISSCSGMLHMYDSVVKNIIGFILEGLFQPDIWTSAALAMKTLSRDCTKNLAEFTPQILSSCKRALDSGQMSQNDCNRIVFCIGRFLPYLPTDQIITAVNEIFCPCMSQLQGLAGQDPQPELKSQLIVILNVFSTLCLSLDGTQTDDEDEEISENDLDPSMQSNNNNSSPTITSVTSANRTQPLIPVVEQILPVLIPVAEKWAKDEEAIDALFSIVKHTLSTIHSSSMTVLQYSMELVLISFRLNPLTSAVGVAKQTILMLGKEHTAVQSRFVGEMHRLCANRLKDCRDPEFVEAYLQFIGQLIKGNSELINSSGISLDFMLHFSIESLNVVDTFKSAIFLLKVAIDKCAVLVPSRVEYFKAHGPTITQKMLLAIGFTVSRSHCQHYADLFVALSQQFQAEWRKWLQECLAVEGFPSSHANQEHKTTFFMKLTRSKVNKRGIQDAINDFAIACRNMSGSEYSVWTTKRI